MDKETLFSGSDDDSSLGDLYDRDGEKEAGDYVRDNGLDD